MTLILYAVGIIFAVWLACIDYRVWWLRQDIKELRETLDGNGIYR